MAAYTTYCPEATSFILAGHTYVVTGATTLTLTHCPCTLTQVLPATTTPPPTGAGSAPAPASASVAEPVATAAADAVAYPAGLGFVVALGAAFFGAMAI